MTDAAKDQDQSMEEILQSIKRIIAEEGEPASPELDVLELTDIIAEDAPSGVSPADLTIDEIMAASTGEVLEHMIPKEEPAVVEPQPEPEEEFELEPEPEPETVAEVPEPEPVAEPHLSTDNADEPLISDTTLAAAAKAFDVLKKIPADMPLPRNNSMRFRSGETVEDLVMESLKPMLREWLDDHLTELVERLVEREVRKITAR